MNSEYKTGLWKKQSQKGNGYYSGKIKIGSTEYYITLFKNNKQNEKQPDLNIILREKEMEIKEEKSPLDDQVFADFGNLVDVKDEDVPF
jgi:hypothetical protein